MRTRTLLPSAAALVLLASAWASAQTAPLRFPRPSPKASVMQTIGTTDVQITYSRPGVKGRKIWGDPPAGAAAGEATLDNQMARPKDAVIVPYGHVWRTGANEATLFKVTDDVLVNGQPLAAGSYSLHTIPGPAEWTVIFNRDDGQWGSFSYDAAKDALRVKARPETTPDTQEWLSYTIEPESESAARVNIRWERLRVPFTVEVKDVQGLALRKARAAVEAAKADDWQTPLQAGSWAVQNKVAVDEGMGWIERSIKVKETFNNLAAKASALASQGKTAEAVATGERALAVGREAKVSANNLTSFEKRLAEWKAKQ